MKGSAGAERAQEIARKMANALLGKPLDLFFPSLGLVESSTYLRASEVRSCISGPDSQALISEIINQQRPALISRFGSTELRVLLKWKNRSKNRLAVRLYKMLANQESPVYSSWEHRNIRTQSGFFPVTQETVNRFCEENYAAIKEIDLLGSWVPGESQFASELASCHVTERDNLEPFWFDQPWTAALEDKRVLVVHPFEDTIRSQYSEKRLLLFARENLLPQFTLLTEKAPQTLGNQTERFDSWFQALDHLTKRCLSHDFDIAIIGAGAYGMPLGARLKQAGKVAFHFGGATQLLFGIRGKRWEEKDLYPSLFNEHWVRPAENERPPGFRSVDGGTYW